MRQLQTIYAEYSNAVKNANIHLESVDNRLMSAFGARKRMAEEKLQDLQLEFWSSVKNSLAGVLIVDTTMSKTKRFIDIAEHIMPVVVQTGDALYKDIAKPVIDTMGAGAWPRHMDIAQWNALFSVLRDKAESMQCSIFPNGQPMLYPDTGRQIPPFNTLEDVVRIIKGMVRHANGDELNKIYLSNSLAKATFEIFPNLDISSDGAPSVIPAILTGIEASEVRGLATLFGKGHLVLTDVPRRDAISKDYVLEVFNNLREKIKNN